MPDTLCQDISRLSELIASGCNTNFALPFNVSMDGKGKCLMQRVNWPTLQFQRPLVGRPACHENIALVELYAALWSNGPRLFRHYEHHCKAFQGMNNTVGYGALLKGWSSCLTINAVCRFMCSVMIG